MDKMAVILRWYTIHSLDTEKIPSRGQGNLKIAEIRCRLQIFCLEQLSGKIFKNRIEINENVVKL